MVAMVMSAVDDTTSSSGLIAEVAVLTVSILAVGIATFTGRFNSLATIS